jgi:hypothetical protein
MAIVPQAYYPSILLKIGSFKQILASFFHIYFLGNLFRDLGPDIMSQRGGET